jgi:hypothetical protein
MWTWIAFTSSTTPPLRKAHLWARIRAFFMVPRATCSQPGGK